ncbi:uncharacterized protein [Coffea arabica]|uniref:Myosin heavy chain, clone 203-like isoform X1 n=1 Tax=Coffea arabica TaxID=13443 RepID=A0A6P6WFH1_COFAR|nr:myosin heavy chain, clone 203-like isoform X1 [Coffea arabica]XP_027112643.1 myosin heavy chain, clone 203-like isoform X1 [Coffea arabica]
MDEILDNSQSLIARIQQLERERDELHKDIEQLCMQQAGPSYLGVATRMHFQRTAALEQEIESLKKKLAVCTRENQNLQEELSEAYHIKSQLAELHGAEVSKNIEAEKQLKFFQNCVAAAFAERDNAIMEAEKAKEKEELASLELNNYKKRIEELTCEYLEEKKLLAAAQADQETHEKQIDSFRKVIDKFYAIRQQTLKVFEDTSWEDKCKHLLNDSIEMWTFCNQEEASTSKYVSALQEEVETLRKSLDNLHRKLQVGLEIESHLKRKVFALEKEKVVLLERIENRISALLDYHSKHRTNVMNLLDEGYSLIESNIIEVEEKLRQLELSGKQSLRSSQAEDLVLHESDCRDVHVNNDVSWASTAQASFWKRDDPGATTAISVKTGDVSEPLAQALQEKVAVLLLLSQEEERHLLERNLNIALQKKIEELQRNLLQVTHEKVRALMELAHLKQEFQVLRENVNQDKREGQACAASGGQRIIQDRDGKLKNLLKKTYLRHWVGNIDSDTDNAVTHLNYEGHFNQKKSTSSVDFARIKIENAALQEILESMEYLTSSVRKLRLALLKANESAVLEGTNTGLAEAVYDIITEARLLKTALGSSLPISWSAEADVESQVDRFEEAIGSSDANSSNEKVDFVSAAGLEMVDLLLFAAQLCKERLARS